VAVRLRKLVLDPVRAAEDAGLRWIGDDTPGLHRVRAGKGFRYQGSDGKPLRDERTRARIDKLAIPPAWTDVWICASPNGHLQATGRDARGRKQYRYHARWRATRDETKYDKMVLFGCALPQIRRRVDADLRRPGLPREKVLATVVRLLETTLIRVGNEEYARANRSFGLTTLRDRHVDVDGAELRFEFRGKSGIKHVVSVHDRRLARVIRRCQDLPGHELFQYIDDDGQRRPIDSQDVNDYLKSITRQDITAKDFRTWNGTVLAAEALCAGATQRAARPLGARGHALHRRRRPAARQHEVDLQEVLRASGGDRVVPRRHARSRARRQRRSRGGGAGVLARQDRSHRRCRSYSGGAGHLILY